MTSRRVSGNDSAPPLGVEAVGADVVGDVRIHHLRYAGGHGARVPADLFQHRAAEGARPAVILQHGANTSKDDLYIQAPARRWARMVATRVATSSSRVLRSALTASGT